MAIDKIQSESINLADTFAFTGTVTGAGGTNTPIFFGKSASDQTMTRGTITKVTGMTGGEIDSDTAFDGTTFTVPSGKGGTYFIYGAVTGDAGDIGQDGEQIRMLIYKNGSSQQLFRMLHRTDSEGDIRIQTVFGSMSLALSAGDTIELYAALWDFNASGNMFTRGDETSLGGYRLIT